MAEDQGFEDAEERFVFFLEERSNIAFEQLVDFAQPFLEMFDVEPAQRALSREIPADPELLETAASALAAAEMFWSYFSLDDGQRSRFFASLRAHFIGTDADPHEMAEFSMLVDILERRWDRIHAQTSFDLSNLMEDGTGNGVRNSTSSIDSADAFADFAKPLVDDPKVYDDPELLERTMAKVQAYWDLARCAEMDFEPNLQMILAEFATTPQEAKIIRSEAEAMVGRYREMFTK